MADQKAKAKNEAALETFDWSQYQDTLPERSIISEVLWKNPFIPIGMVATVLALGLGVVNLIRQDSKKQQFYMRARVGAQGFTIMSMLAGVFYHAKSK